MGKEAILKGLRRAHVERIIRNLADIYAPKNEEPSITPYPDKKTEDAVKGLWYNLRRLLDEGTENN